MKILHSIYLDEEKSAIDFEIELDDGTTIPYCYKTSLSDESDISIWLTDLLNNQAVVPEPRIKHTKTVEEIGREIRHIRDHLLEITDKLLTVPDYPISDSDKELVRQYRQTLRDITKQDGFPENVIWPEIPDCIKDKVDI